MGHAETTGLERAAGRSRALVLAALAVALALLGWRAVSVFTETGQGQAAGTPEETRLAALLEPVAGAGRARVSIRRTGDGAAHYLVMLDRAPDAGVDVADRIEAVIAAAAGYDADAGDALSIQQFPFAAGAAGRPEDAALIELAGLAALCGLIAAFLFTQRSAADIRSAPQARQEPAPARLAAVRPMTPELVDDEAGPALRKAGEAAAADPGGAARVIRRWISADGDAA